MAAEAEAAKTEAENIRYVQVQDPSGWPTMAKTVRDADIDRIADCKEDMDTLLVFAGLYSAVLSAFIIESYKTLQQDNQEVMVGLMRQLVAQNFTSRPGFLNSTTPLPELPRFDPPPWAIRVNVMWFISLILSLSAASFGMLVKQWLREYLALEYTAPQARLRARQYRSPALSKWKVFEIAAILPLLLQISLGLFFVGLCFFTAAVHSSIKKCTIPVVCAWAFFLLITTIAPLFSPRCPFKTTFLKSTLKAGRRYVAPASRHTIHFIGQSIHYFLHDASFSRKFGDVMTTVHKTIAPIYTRARLCLQHSHGALRTMWELTVGARWETWSSFRYHPCVMAELLIEEEEFLKTEEEDTEMMLSIDSLMADDGLLPIMMEMIRKQPNPASVVSFVLQVLGRRIGQSLPTQGLTRIPNLSSLSKRAWSVTTDAIANTLRRHHSRPMGWDSPSWVFDAVIILLSRSPYTLSQLVVGALRDVIAQKESYCIELGKRLAGGVTANNPFPGLSQQLLQLREVPDGAVSPHPLVQIYTGLLCQDHPHDGLLWLLYAHGPDELRSTSAGIMKDLFDMMLSIGSWRISRDAEALSGDDELVFSILRYGGEFGRLNNTIRFSALVTANQRYTNWVMGRFAAVHSAVRVDERVEHLLLDAYSSSVANDRDSMINNMTFVLQELCNGNMDDPTDFIPMDTVRLCRLLLKIYFAAEYHNTDVWRALWAQCAKAIERYHKKAGWSAEQAQRYWLPDTPLSTPDEVLRDDQNLTRECLTIIASHPESYTTADLQGNTPIPAQLVAALCLFATSEVKQQFNHFQQILLLPTNDSSDIGEEDEASEGEDNEDEDSEDKEDGEGEDKEGEGEGKREGQDAESEDNMDGEGEGGEKNVNAESGDGERRIAEADEHDRAALQDSIDVDIGASISQTLDTRADATRQETLDMVYSGGAGIGEGLLYI